MLRVISAVLLAAAVASAAGGQTPQPFPRPGAPQSQPAAPPQSPPSPQQPARPAPEAATDPNAPSAATLGAPIYPASQFLASYDAGRGQRYYVFGTTASFADIVSFYRTQLDEKGDLVFKDPPTHMFDVGRFREETMAFPPSVTVKDWTSAGSQGYPNPKLGAQPARFPTIVMIVPPPPVAPAAGR